MTISLIKEQALKYQRALTALLVTGSKLERYDQSIQYSDETLELYDASGARFTRTYECALKLFRAKDLYDSIHPATTYRDLIHHMASFEWVEQSEGWMEMKIIRNKLNHEYLPFDQELIYNFILSEALSEFQFVANKLKADIN